jgi:hypothetical protein
MDKAESGQLVGKRGVIFLWQKVTEGRNSVAQREAVGKFSKYNMNPGAAIYALRVQVITRISASLLQFAPHP